MTISWITASGNLGTYTERVITDISLKARSSVGPISFKLISGKLPRGLRLEESVSISGNETTVKIKGSPTEVRVFTTSRFVIRASDGEDIEDRTFSITIDGDDIPEWITKEGFLNVGPNDAFYVMDNSQVDFQLEVRDPDLTAGDKLEFYLIASGGEMPPGLTLSKSGRIFGFTDPIFALEYTDTPSGAYDSAAFDIVPIDVASNKTTGFDSYLYDFETYDFKEGSQAPRRLSRFYTFVVGVSDGIHEIRRLFRIYVVTEEFLKADNSIIQVDSNLFQADASGERKPIWITESNLGRIRANNYVTIFLDVYDPPTLPGYITYFLLPTNPGTYKLKGSGEIIYDGRFEITGEYPLFPYNSKGVWKPTEKYTIGDAVLYSNPFDSTIINILWICIKPINPNPAMNIFGPSPAEGEYWTRQGILQNSQRFEARDTFLWEVIEEETQSQIPPGLTLDNVTGNIAGRVPYQSAVTKRYKFTMQAVSFPPIQFDENYILLGDWDSRIDYELNQAVRYNGFIWLCIKAHRDRKPQQGEPYWDLGVETEEKTFFVDIIGELESSIEWISDSDLGSIKPNIPSKLKVEANALSYSGRTIYSVVEGALPPGLELIPTNGLIQGKVRQFDDTTGPGLIRFYDRTDEWASDDDSSTRSRNYNISFDGGLTSFDREFHFTVEARDTAGSAASTKSFKIFVNTERNVIFANLYGKAFQEKSKRLSWYDFITDFDIFKEEEIYRYGDPNFGVQSEIKMLLYAGIEARDAQYFIQAMGKNHYHKQVRFGDLKYAVAKDPETQNVIYEVVYVEIVDEYEKNGKSISKTIELSNKINSKVLVSYDAIKVDSDIPFVSDSDHQRIFPNSYKNMRSRIKAIGEREREFLPLWMRSIQPDSFVETGFVKSLVLCYCKPGFAQSIISRIKTRGFDFKSINFTIDRYLIDAVNGELGNKYLAFQQRGEKLP